MSTDTKDTNALNAPTGDRAVEFNGSGFGLFGWGLLMGLANVLLIPAA